MSDLNHPCKDTCSGWAQGYEAGFNQRDVEIERLKLIEMKYENLSRTHNKRLDELGEKIQENTQLKEEIKRLHDKYDYQLLVKDRERLKAQLSIAVEALESIKSIQAMDPMIDDEEAATILHEFLSTKRYVAKKALDQINAIDSEDGELEK